MGAAIGSSHASRVAAISASQQQADANAQAAAFQQQQLQSAQDAAALAQQTQISAIQRNVSVDTWNLLKQFGQRNAIAGANLSVPLSTATGGFANPPATASGRPR
jgi:type II secretory pathway pseudopilin PulG